MKMASNFEETSILIKIAILNDLAGIMGYWEGRISADPKNQKLKKIADIHINLYEEATDYICKLYDSHEIYKVHNLNQTRINLEQLYKIKGLEAEVKKLTDTLKSEL